MRDVLRPVYGTENVTEKLSESLYGDFLMARFGYGPGRRPVCVLRIIRSCQYNPKYNNADYIRPDRVFSGWVLM